MKKVHTNKGFTLAELLIVVAIIAVMVAIAIPTFGNQLEKSREATDLANFRAAYAEVMNASLQNPNADHSASVTTKQAVAGWQSESHEVAGTMLEDTEAVATAAVEIKYTAGLDGSGTVAIGSTTIASSFLNDSAARVTGYVVKTGITSSNFATSGDLYTLSDSTFAKATEFADETTYYEQKTFVVADFEAGVYEKGANNVFTVTSDGSAEEGKTYYKVKA